MISVAAEPEVELGLIEGDTDRNTPLDCTNISSNLFCTFVVHESTQRLPLVMIGPGLGKRLANPN